MATTKHNEATATEAVAEKKPRLSRVERLRLELAEANAKQQGRLAKKIEAIETRLSNRRAQLAKVQAEIDAIEAELAEARAEGPIVSDGVGETSIRNRQGTESDETTEADESDESDETTEADESDETTEADESEAE